MNKFYLFVFISALSISALGQNNYFYSNTVHHYETVVNGNLQWHYFIGNSEPDTNWRRLSFNDATWATGNGGIGYGDNDDATIIGTCSSVYMRKQFSITDTSKITELLLSIDYDDGFVAYINNVEIARKNIGTSGIIPFYNTPASRTHEANLYRGLNADYFVVNKDIMQSVVKNGTNVLCIQVHNFTTTADNDLTALPYLMAGMNNSNTVYSSNPTWFNPPFYSHLPIIQIIANNVAIVNEPKKTMGMRIISNEPFQNHLSDSAKEYSGKIGIELHGASSINFAQKSYGVTTYDTSGVADNVKLFDFPKESDYILYGPYNDKSLMRNVMMYDLARKMGWYASRCKFVEVLLDTQYIGIYVFMEKIKIDKNRVAISQILPTHNAGDSLTGGYIFKVDWNADPGLGTWNSHVTNFNSVAKTVKFQTSDPNGADITNSQRNYIESYIDSFEQNLLIPNAMTNITTGYRKYIDVGSFIDYYILYEITHNVDAYRASTYFFKNKASQGGKIVMGPLWDFNYSLGNANFCTSNDTNGWSGCTPNNTIWWFDALTAENYFRDQLRCRWTSLYNSLLSPDNINKYIDSLAAYLEVPQQRHFIKWNILGTDLYNGHVSSNYSQEITWLKNWYRGRTKWVNLFMPGWHNPCSESNYVNRIIVTEINYNSDKNFDPGNWIEIYNNSSGAVNLNNFVLTANGGANSKKFGNLFIPANSYMVICEDTNLFNQVYPGIKNKTGNLNFGFNNNGGSIILYDPGSYQVFNIIYSNKLPWPQGPDGGGKTLEHIGYNNTYNNASNWFEGCLGGSPGRAYGRCVQEVNVTEINYAAATVHNTGDWFEIKNNSNNPKNIGGYVFKDDDDTHIFTFPTNFIIGANEYCVVCADTTKFKSFHPNIKNRIGNFNFGISNKNDAIRLYTNNNVLYQSIYYTDTAAPWPSGANGTGYTIELKNDSLQCDAGSNWTIGCLFGSPGKRYHKLCNPALSAKLSVSEINTKPPLYADDGGWIELHNYDAQDLDLTDFVLSHGNPNDAPYQFKEGTIIKKNDYLLLCNDTSKFKKLHPGITNFVTLNNWKFNVVSDSVLIKDFNTISLVRLSYDLNQNVFEEANGLGKTLELRNDTLNGNIFANWFTGCFGGSPAEAYKVCNKPKITVTEINYKSSPNFNQGFWFEIKNIDTSIFNLSNYYFRIASDTLKYRFEAGVSLAPQGYYVIAIDSADFVLNNPFISNAMFKSVIGLNRKKDILQLFDDNGQICNARFLDTIPYPLSANGAGYTLDLNNDTLNPFFAVNLSTQCYSGSPGSSVLLPCNPALSSNIVVSEINYRSNSSSNSGFWFELENRDSLPIALQNWIITTGDLKMNYKISGNITIPAKGYLVVTNDSIKFKQQNPSVNNYINIPLLFNSSADSIKLFDYRGFNACKAYYNSDTSWQQSANGLGYTLERNGINKSALLNSNWKPGCIKGSPGKAFTPCNVSKLIVSEINYKSNSSNNSGQWLELKNTTGTSLNLNNYVLKFNISDSLKINAQLYPGNYLVVINDSVLFKNQHPFITNFIYKKFSLDTLKNAIQVFENNQPVNGIYYSSFNNSLQAANGGGYTLELINDTLNETIEKSWTTGCYKGSPGTKLLTPCNPAALSNIIFTEINYKSDTFNNSGQWFELRNLSTQPVHLENWVVSNGKKGFKVILDDLVLLSGDYLVLSNDTASFHKIYPFVNNVSFLNFQIGASSDTISLLDYSELLACKAYYSNTIGWFSGPNGYGRTLEHNSDTKNSITISDWKEGCILGSPGKSYTPCIEKVIISELNYAPDPTADDGKWLELFITSNAPTNLNKYFFRTGDTITSHSLNKPVQPNAYIVLCNDSISFNKYHKFISNKEQFPLLKVSKGTHNLILYDQDYSILQSMQYSSVTPWDSMANERGYTLELMKDSFNFSHADNWKSYCKRGSAGMATISPCGNAFGVSAKNKNAIPKIYPNPAGKELTIVLGTLNPIGSEYIEFKIQNLLGQTIWNGNLSDNVTTLNISGLSAGVYFISISNMEPLKFLKY